MSVTKKKEKMNTEEEVNKFLLGRKKPFYIDTFRSLLRQYDKEEISLSKVVEELNMKAFKWQQSQSADVAEKKADKEEEIKILRTALVQIVKHNSGFAEYYMQHNYRLMYDLWKNVSEIAKQALNPKG